MKLILCVLFLISLKAGLTQNLIPNGKFEDTISCPNASQQLSSTIYWFTPLYIKSTDYFNSCNSGQVGVPKNEPGFQYAKSGVAYVGISPYSNISDFREYLSVKLINILNKDSEYIISFWINLANRSKYAISKADIGIFFSNDSIYTNQSHGSKPLPYQPQEYAGSTNEYIEDTLDWTNLIFKYRASGDEKYLTLGNFNYDLSTSIKVANSSGDSFAYYYIDDVSLIKLPDYSVSLDSIPYNSNCYSDSSTLKLYFHNTGTKELDFSVDTITFHTEVKVNNNVVQTIESTLSNNLNNPTPNTPLQPDSSMSIDIFPVDLSRLGELHDIIITASFKRDEDTTNNTITKQITPVLDLGNITVAPQIVCSGETVTLNSTNYIGEPTWQHSSDGLNWQNFVQGASAVHSPLDSMYYRVKICDFLTSDSILVQVPEVPKATIFIDSICGAGYHELIPVLPNTIDNLYWYYTTADVSPFHSGLSYTNYFEKNQTYYIRTIMNNCPSETKTPVHLIVEECPLEIPNVFTPNGDGLNDLFYFHNAKNKELFTEIYNRWGNLVDSWKGNPGWDGADIPEGVYYYIIRERAPNKDKVYKGSFTLLR